MKEIRIPLECFDVGTFFNKTIRFLKKGMSPDVDPTYAMVWTERPGDVPGFGSESGWDVLSVLNREEKMLFSPFPRADADGTLNCADGDRYTPPSDEADSETEMLMCVEDSVGILAHVKNAYRIINTTICADGASPALLPSVEHVQNSAMEWCADSVIFSDVPYVTVDTQAWSSVC